MRAADRFWKHDVQGEPYRYIDSAIRDYHDWSLLYEDGRREFTRIREKVKLPIGPGVDVYEIGCGAGRLTAHLGEHCGRVLGVDISEFYLDLARAHSRRQNVAFELVTEAGLPLNDAGHWDVVFSYQVMHYLPLSVFSHYVCDVSRLLRPGGRLIFQFDTRPITLTTRVSWMLRRVLYRLGIPEWRGVSNSPGLFRHVSAIAVLRRALTDAGLVVENIIDPVAADSWFLVRKPARIGE
ncbi:MAG: class I SAM-dependent methyltransferase [Nitrospirota bacterium]